jgi:hypothetical protein
MRRDDLPPWPVVAAALGGPALAVLNGVVASALSRRGLEAGLCVLLVLLMLAFGYSSAGLLGAALTMVRRDRG